MILAGLLPALMVAAAIAFPALRALAGPGAWLLLIGSAVAATARWARTGLRGGRGRAAVATTAAACAISGAVSLRWAEFLTTYRFPLEADAATYLDYMQRFTWGSPDHGLYSAGFGPWEPLFVALGNGFFRLTGASHLALRLLTIGLAILGVCLTYLAGRRFFRSRLIGALAAGFLAGSPYLVFDAARGYRTPLELCLFLGVALACWTARPGMSWVRTLLAGGLAAGLCLTRLPYLPAALVVIIAGVWKGAGSARRALPGAAVAIGLVAVLVVPLLVAGQAKHGHYFYGALGRGALTWLVLEGEQLGATGDDTRLVWRSMSVSEVLHGLDRVMRTAGGWPRTLARGCALALRDVAVLGAQRAYWFALLALGLLLASPYRFVLAAALLSIAHVAPFYAIGAQTIPDAVAFPADPGIYHSFYGGDLFAYGVISRYRHLAQGAPFAALAAAWLTVTAATGVGRLLWHRTPWRWKPVGAVRPREAPRPLGGECVGVTSRRPSSAWCIEESSERRLWRRHDGGPRGGLPRPPERT
jgi:4-amino-4-deoxy-L-arabinose transferase-like glycosyltransferase